jgi:hypothetical protein
MNETLFHSFHFIFILQLFSFALWQITSTEKLKASANAAVSNHDCLPKEMIIMQKQNKLTIMVSAFFSEKYFFR